MVNINKKIIAFIGGCLAAEPDKGFLFYEIMSDYIIRPRFESNFAQVPKSCLKDKNVSLKAKGLYSYLFSLPEDWKVYKSEILTHFTDGKDSLNAAFKELEKFGYLESEAIRENGLYKGFKLTLLEYSKFDTERIKPMRKNRNCKSGDGKTASNNTLLNDNIYSDYIKEFSNIRGINFKETNKTLISFTARIKDGFTLKEMITALKNAMTDQYHIENRFNNLTPEFITRSDKLEKYLNYQVNKKQSISNSTIVF